MVKTETRKKNEREKKKRMLSSKNEGGDVAMGVGSPP